MLDQADEIAAGRRDAGNKAKFAHGMADLSFERLVVRSEINAVEHVEPFALRSDPPGILAEALVSHATLANSPKSSLAAAA